MRDKTILVTGATSGIGLQASIALARRGARVVLVGRDRARTDAAVADVAAWSGSRKVSSLLCDFSSQAEIRRLADKFLAQHDRLDALVNNAGQVNKSRREMVDGIEATFAVNHLGYFLLTNLLLDLIVRSAPARVVSVASVAHRQGTLDFDDLGFARGGYGILRAYARSKLANVLFAAELARRLDGTGVTSNSLHPGSVDTRIWSGAPLWAKPMVALLFRPFFISAEKGGSYIVDLVTRPQLANVTGKYFEEGEMKDPAPLAQDRALAARLWDVSKSMVGLVCLVLAIIFGCAGMTFAQAPDPYFEKPRVIVLTDIANEPDDQMSMVRFLVYSNEFDIEGLIATTSTWMKRSVRPDVIRSLIDAYEQVQPNLLKHAPGFPAAAALRHLVVSGQPTYGMAAVGPEPEKMSPGAELILGAADRVDPDGRPLWILAWGGTNTLAQALLHARATRTPAQLEALLAKVRVYTISDQDDAGPWIRREFPALPYIASPSTQDGEQYYFATWTGISGDRFYKNAPGADFTTFTDDWVNTNIRAKGPLGKLYPFPCCIHEGDTPSFLGLINNGLASAMSPAFGGWGGRYIWRQPAGESRPFWTQGGDSYPGRDNSRDTVVGVDGQRYTSDQATIWRWRTAFQHDFAARMDWTIKDVREANHNPEVMVNGQAGKAPIRIDATVDTPLTLDAAGTRDPDGHGLKYTWFFYAEAGTGIPGQPVVTQRRPAAAAAAAAAAQGQGGIPSAPRGGPPELPLRVTIDNGNSARVTVTPRVAGVAHIILAVEDDGTPSLTAYRRVILTINAR